LQSAVDGQLQTDANLFVFFFLSRNVDCWSHLSTWPLVTLSNGQVWRW
jgi:hypothetical protein